MEFQSYEGTCMYCGSMQPIMAADQADADMKITEGCSCRGAELDKQEKAIDTIIESIAGEKSITKGFKAVDEEQKKYIREAAKMVARDYFLAANFKLEDTTAININKSKGKVKITRKYTKQATMEA